MKAGEGVVSLSLIARDPADARTDGCCAVSETRLASSSQLLLWRLLSIGAWFAVICAFYVGFAVAFIYAIGGALLVGLILAAWFASQMWMLAMAKSLWESGKTENALVLRAAQTAAGLAPIVWFLVTVQ